MCGSMVDIQSVAAEIRRGIKKIEDRKKPQGKNIMSASATQGGHNNMCSIGYCMNVIILTIVLDYGSMTALCQPTQTDETLYIE